VRRFGLAAVVLSHAGLAQAQSWEASMLAGYTPSTGLERRAPELDQLDVAAGFTFGAQVARALSPRWSAELLWTQHHSALDAETEGGANHLFTFSVDNFHANAVRHLAGPDAKLRPFLFGGLGASLFSGGGLPSETKFSWGIGGGVKYFPRGSIGVRGQARYKPVVLNDGGSGDFCDPFGFCQGWLNQVELAGGITVRF
jgi:opacity protein-like surface antigen